MESHEELFKVHNELHTALKTYFLCLNDCRQCETKYRVAEDHRVKVKSSIPEEKQTRNRKFKMWTKEAAKVLYVAVIILFSEDGRIKDSGAAVGRSVFC